MRVCKTESRKKAGCILLPHEIVNTRALQCTHQPTNPTTDTCIPRPSPPTSHLPATTAKACERARWLDGPAGSERASNQGGKQKQLIQSREHKREYKGVTLSDGGRTVHGRWSQFMSLPKQAKLALPVEARSTQLSLEQHAIDSRLHTVHTRTI